MEEEQIKMKVNGLDSTATIMMFYRVFDLIAKPKVINEYDLFQRKFGWLSLVLVCIAVNRGTLTSPPSHIMREEKRR